MTARSAPMPLSAVRLAGATRIVALLAFAVTALLTTTAGAATSALNGDYTVTIAGAHPTSLNGLWKLHLAIDTNTGVYGGGTQGSFSLFRNARLMADGPYVLSYSSSCDGTSKRPCNTVQFNQLGGPQECPQTPVGGVYTYTTSGSQLVLKPLYENCPSRKLVLGSHPFARSK